MKILKQRRCNVKEVTIYTDGACSGNPGPGGWCAILVYRGTERVVKGGEPMTTNNRMELSAVLNALQLLKEPCRVTVVSDSKYVVDAVEKGWLQSWQRNGWRKADKKPVLNVELWQELLPQLTRHEVSFSWIRGHAGHPYNERCDRIAVEYYQRLTEDNG
ncbi:MAG: ribonuclease HI [Clostridia bacterium]|nr:ribonuclease HI [Clostridia bacterium]